MIYKIIFRERAKRKLKSIPKKDTIKIFEAIKNLSKNPFPVGCKKLKARNGYRIRKGNYRVIYEINNQKITVLILEIGNRKDIYKK